MMIKLLSSKIKLVSSDAFEPQSSEYLGAMDSLWSINQSINKSLEPFSAAGGWEWQGCDTIFSFALSTPVQLTGQTNGSILQTQPPKGGLNFLEPLNTQVNFRK